MPVLIKVGVSRKLSKDFNSTGYTLDITSELPIGAAQDPNAMAQATDELFQLAEDLIEAQVAKDGSDHAPPSPASSRPAPRVGNGQATRSNTNGQGGAGGFRNGGGRAYAGNGHGNGNGQVNGRAEGRPLTDAQARAIENMAKAVDCTGDRVAHDEFGVAVRDLTVRQASELIDQLRKSIEATKPQGGRR